MKRWPWIVLVSVVGAGLLIVFNYSFGKTVDGAHRFNLVLSPAQEKQIVEIRYWPIPRQDRLDPDQLLPDSRAGLLETVERQPDGTRSITLPFSCDEYGLVLAVRKWTAPPSKVVWLRVRDIDGQTTVKKAPLVAPDGHRLDDVRIPEK